MAAWYHGLMMTLKQAFEAVAPSTPTGFLAAGWLASALAGFLCAILASMGWWLLNIVVVLVLYVPLWVRAKRFRDHEVEVQRFFAQLAEQLEAEDNLGDKGTSDKGTAVKGTVEDE